MKTDYHVHFYLKLAKKNKAGFVPIILRLVVNGQRAEYSISRRIDPKLWNANSEKVNGNNRDAKEINDHISNLKHKLNRIHQSYIDSDTEVTVKNFMYDLRGGSNIKSKLLLAVFEEHNKRMDTLVDKDISASTASRYWTCYSHLEAFIKEEYKNDDYRLNDIDYQFINKLEYYLKTVRKCNHNSTLKYINNFKKIIRIALANGWMERDPFYNYKAQFKPVEREFLTQEEIVILYEKDLHFDRLRIVRDMFLFSCYTGLAYADVKKLTTDDIIKGIDGYQWIKTKRTKTDSVSSIPLLPMAMEILKKYQDHPEVKRGPYILPVLSNQKSNAFLKEIAELCGIKKNLTTHLARHTFATTVTLSNGVPIESVSRMLGHKSLRTTQHYAKIVDRKISDDMSMLRAKLHPESEQKKDKKK
ncbi:Site-specific recombinase XerD [Pustulibacterium marinum]|uniref:Site-specific recombinase XerD n=1 Tax=Pustulibacterium marinum TaxID=1224947 RepID=A0A1I7HU82_9FLAO|nr:site-specific integrase [Pustulibacterium marinum]SFU64294.1 Site-specific recombinase XerD [Pustulibacterium marinum]